MSRNKQTEFTGPLPFRMTNDYLFKVLLQTNSRVLKAIICCFTHLTPKDIKEIIVTNPILLGRILSDKEMILDVKAILDDDYIVNLEMQVLNLHNWEERSISYLTRCFDNLKEGEDYSQVRTSIHIGFVDFTPKPENVKFFSKYRIKDTDSNYQFSSKFELSVVDLSRRDIATNEDISAHRLYWADFFKATTWEELIMLAEKDSNIADAVMTIKQLSEEEYFRLCCEAQEDRIRCQNGLMNRIEKAEKTIEERDKEIEKLDKEIEKRNKELEKRNKELEKRNKDMIRIQKEAAETIALHEEEILKLKQKIALLTNS